MDPKVRHFFTVDVEEHFQVSAFEPFVARGDWHRHESRVHANVTRLLEMLERHGARGTFFTLGCVAERVPAVVRDIVAAGHELASHGGNHQRVTHLSRDEFRADVRQSKRVLEDLSGAPVLGYRAPSFSIVPGFEWALDILLEEGYRYDSSLFPIRRPGYGYPGGKRVPHWIERPGGRLAEFPPATRRLLGLTLPAAGGAYLRIFPFTLARGAVRDFDRRGIPATVYVHPWEVDPGQPRVAADASARFRHYTGLARMQSRLERLLREFRFTSIEAGLKVLPADAAVA